MITGLPKPIIAAPFDKCPACGQDFAQCPHTFKQADEFRVYSNMRQIVREEVIRALYEYHQHSAVAGPSSKTS